MPALAAGLSFCGSDTSAPVACFRPRLSAMSGVTVWICTPIQPRVTLPLSRSCATTLFTVSAGIAFVDRCVDLNEIVIGTGADVAAARRNDTGRHGAAEPERIADGENPV